MVALPVAADVRRLRSKLNVAIGTALGRVRGPALIALGAAGSTGALVRSLGRGPTSCPSRTEELREDPHTPMPASLTSQGEVTWNHLAARPEAADLMNWTALWPEPSRSGWRIPPTSCMTLVKRPWGDSITSSAPGSPRRNGDGLPVTPPRVKVPGPVAHRAAGPDIIDYLNGRRCRTGRRS